MKLLESDQCVAGALAMLLNEEVSYIKMALFTNPLSYPFPPPWDTCPLVPGMETLTDWLYTNRRLAMTPFVLDPKVSPHEDCAGIPLWPHNPMATFERQLAYGSGLLLGYVGDIGHMCAWDGRNVYDPRGYTYSLNVANRFNFKPAQFWLASKVKT